MSKILSISRPGFGIVSAFSLLVMCVIWLGLLAVILDQSDHASKFQKRYNLSFLDFTETRFTTVPATWQPRHIAKMTFFYQWCENTKSCTDRSRYGQSISDDEFIEDWLSIRNHEMTLLTGTSFRNRNLKNAKFNRAFLPLSDFRGADLDHADLSRAYAEASDFRDLGVSDFIAPRAVFASSDFRGVTLNGANLVEADLQEINIHCNINFDDECQPFTLLNSTAYKSGWHGAYLRGATFDNVDVSCLQEERVCSKTLFNRTDLAFANVINSDFAEAAFYDANLFGTTFAYVDLTEAVLARARMIRANFIGSFISPQINNENSKRYVFAKTEVEDVSFHGTALRNVDLTLANGSAFDLSTSFGDGSVILPNGISPPCQWGQPDEAGKLPVLDDAEFFGRWRGWWESNPNNPKWEDTAPERYRGHTAIDPPCTWAAKPMLSVDDIRNASTRQN